MHTFKLFLFLLAVLNLSLFGQEKTDQKKIEVNEITGDSTFTKSVIISQTEDITPRTSMLVVNPLKFLLFYNISYYHKISEKTVIGFGIQTPTLSGLTGFGLNAELRIHPSGKNLRGFYFAPNISYNLLKVDDVSTNPVSIGALIGWQWFPGDEFAIGLGIGADYYFGNVSKKDEKFGNYDGTAPALRFDIGYAW